MAENQTKSILLDAIHNSIELKKLLLNDNVFLSILEAVVADVVGTFKRGNR